jgi:hypothetical protein
MAVDIAADAVAEFSKKLEGFSATLSDEERTLLKGMLTPTPISERGGSGVSDRDLAQVTGGHDGFIAARHVSFASFAPRLNASFFTRLMSW